MKYLDARPLIQTGDAILWKGHGVVSKMIMWWTEFSHASLVVRLDKYEEFENRVFLVEAMSGGLEFRLLSERLKQDAEAYWLLTSMTKKQRNLSRKHALIECAKGKKYDFGSIVKNIVCEVNADARDYFCSEFVQFNWTDTRYIKPMKKAVRPDGLLELANYKELVPLGV